MDAKTLTKTSDSPSKGILKPRNISGFADYTEAQNYLLSCWIRIIELVYSLYGFTKLIPRPIELKEVLLSKGGIQKQVFGISRLPGDSATDLALPFDRTVPLANWVAKHHGEMDFPYKRYDIGYSFRGERPQNGRFQGFYQADIDIIGRAHLPLSADAECMAVIFEAITKLGIGHVYITINNLCLTDAILSTFKLTADDNSELLQTIDDIPKVDFDTTLNRLNQMPSIIKDDALKLANIFTFTGSIEEFIIKTSCPSTEDIINSLNNLSVVYNLLLNLGIPATCIQFKPCIVRGLDYYTGTVFETFIKDFEHFGSVASGGRYDDLTSTFTKEKLPGFGGSIGLTRLFDLACKNSMVELNKKTEAEILVCHMKPGLIENAMELASALRAASIKTDVYTGENNISRQLKYANNKGFTKAILVMETNSFILKDMETGNQQEFKTIHFLLNHLKFNN